MMFPTFALTMALPRWTFQKQEYSLGIAAWLAQTAGSPKCKVHLETSATWIILEENQEPFAVLMN